MFKYNAVCISSAGVRGYQQLGGLHYLEKNGFLSQCEFYSGTSAGSIISMLMSIGYSCIDILKWLCERDINSCIKYNFNIDNFVKNYGIIKTDLIKDYLSDMVIQKLGFVPTLSQHYKLTGKHFICTAVCLTSKPYVRYFSHITYPDLNIVDAVILSSSIPILFTKSEYQNELYIDGAISDRLPVNYLYNFIKEHSDIINPNILGIDVSYSVKTIKNLKDYITAILYHPIRNQCDHHQDVKLYVLENLQNDVERLDVGISQRLKLFTDGYTQIKNTYQNSKSKKD
jgi:predicted acylesterase/phospholipase RssA